MKKTSLVIILIVLFNSIGFSQSWDTLNKTHVFGLGMKFIDHKNYELDSVTVDVKYGYSNPELYYSLLSISDKKWFTKIDASVSYATGSIDYKKRFRDNTGTKEVGTAAYVGNFKMLRVSSGISRGLKLNKDGSFCFSFGFDLQAKVYAGGDLKHTVNDTLGSYLAPIIIKSETDADINKIIKPFRFIPKMELFKRVSINPKLGIVGGLRLAISRHDFDKYLLPDPNLMLGIYFGIDL